jgi:hypothetical protein
VEDLLKKDLFSSGTVESTQVTLDGKMAAQLKLIREHTPNRINPAIKAPERKEEKPSSTTKATAEPTKPEPKKVPLKTSGNVPNTSKPDSAPPPPPVPAPPPPPKNVDLPPMSSGRQDLLASIRNADNLKKLKKVNAAKKK